MRILRKYILKELAGPFLFGICAFASIFVGGDVLFGLARLAKEYGPPFFVLVELFILKVPGIVVYTFPMSVLLAVLLTFSKLSGQSEIIAMKACGVSFRRIVTPVLLFALFMSGVTFVFNETIVPASKQAYEKVLKVQVEKSKYPQTQKNISLKETEQGALKRIFYASEFDGSTLTMHNVVAQEFENEQLVRIIKAKDAVWDKNAWYFYAGTIYDLNGQPGKGIQTLSFQKQKIAIPTEPQEMLTAQKEPEEMKAGELRKYIEYMKRQGNNTSDLLVQYYNRFSFPLASFIFALIGASLGLQPHRSGSSIGLGLSIIVILIYYVLMTVGTVIGQSGSVHPMFAAWLANIVMGTAGVYLLKQRSR